MHAPPTPTLAELTADPHPALAALRSRQPVSWVEAVGGWMVLSYDLAVQVMRDADTFTVDDPRFTTSRVVGRSMLSTDGEEHRRHRSPFIAPFTPRATRETFAAFVENEADRLVAGLAARNAAELRTAVAGPMAVACMRFALGLEQLPVDLLLGWYRDIVGAVDGLTPDAAVPPSGLSAYGELSTAVLDAAARSASPFLAGIVGGADALSPEELAGNVAVLLFGGIETTEGMIANLLFHLFTTPGALTVSSDAAARRAALQDALEESLRLEPAAAEVDRYATRDVEIGGASVRRGDLVIVSLTAANRDPAVFADPDAFRPGRENGRRHLAFAQGPHICPGLHLARLETLTLLDRLLRLPGFRPAAGLTPPTGLVFRKPLAVPAVWS
ncbi:cytochrome P450 [Nakamurella sp. YIM 132087]|uniref:Cytochrome P450 n=1 Tax=Nakamurella alba TaxID=2665158 RepID=A0A7K1FQP2_9ACTN|nr:cytochrome P450 [Nakamurella alba]